MRKASWIFLGLAGAWGVVLARSLPAPADRGAIPPAALAPDAEAPPAVGGVHAAIRGAEPSEPRAFNPGFRFGTIWFDPEEATPVTFTLPSPEGPVSQQASVVRWYPGIEETELWTSDADVAIVWQDERGRTGMWVHAGGGTSFSPIRNALELGDFGLLRHRDTVGGLLGSLIGAPATLVSGGHIQEATVAAAVRVDAEDVDEFERQAMDMPAWLADAYPGAHFQSVLDGERFLMLVFCGRKLSGDRERAFVPYWAQARFALVLQSAP